MARDRLGARALGHALPRRSATHAALLLRFDVYDEPPWHTMTRRDEHIWEEEVVEIFLDPDRTGPNYYELEINPVNVVCDLVVVKPWPELHSDPAWDFAGVETRVVPYRGEHAGPDGWTATARLPWDGFRALPSARGAPAAGGRSVALQPLSHQAATRGGAAARRCDPRRVVADRRAELPRAGRIPRFRVRRAGM